MTLVKNTGWPSWFGLAGRAARFVVQALPCELYVLDQPCPPGAEPAGDFSVDALAEADWPALRALARAENAQAAAALARLEDAQRRAYQGCVFRRGDTVVGYTLCCTQAMGHEQMSVYGVRLEPDELFGFDTYFAPRWRGANVPAQLMKAAVARAQGLGYRRMYALVRPENRRSALVHLRVGFRKLGLRRAWAIAGQVIVSARGMRWSRRLWL